MSDPSDVRAAEARVHKFMADFEAQWQVAAPAFENRDPDDPKRAFRQWRELMDQTTRAHFITNTTVNLASSFSRPPEYGPGSENLLRSEIDGDTAYVLTQSTSPLKKFHEYTLRQQDGEWRIATISDYYAEPTAPFVDRAAVDERIAECAPDAHFNDMPTAQSQLDERRMFTDRTVTLNDGSTADAHVEEIGTLSTNSGVLSVLDFGYDNDDARPLARTVPSGSYPVDRVTAFGRNAAVRVRFTDTDPVAWHPASIPGSGHVVGVDAGCVCLVDYPAYATLTHRAKAAVFDQLSTFERPAAMPVPLGDSLGIAVESGYGDGSYPAYWGIDADGRTAQLVVDFMILVESDDDGALITL